MFWDGYESMVWTEEEKEGVDIGYGLGMRMVWA